MLVAGLLAASAVNVAARPDEPGGVAYTIVGGQVYPIG
jgi:hypothetical protein